MNHWEIWFIIFSLSVRPNNHRPVNQPLKYIRLKNRN